MYWLLFSESIFSCLRKTMTTATSFLALMPPDSFKRARQQIYELTSSNSLKKMESRTQRALGDPQAKFFKITMDASCCVTLPVSPFHCKAFSSVGSIKMEQEVAGSASSLSSVQLGTCSSHFCPLSEKLLTDSEAKESIQQTTKNK